MLFGNTARNVGLALDVRYSGTISKLTQDIGIHVLVCTLDFLSNELSYLCHIGILLNIPDSWMNT